MKVCWYVMMIQCTDSWIRFFSLVPSRLQSAYLDRNVKESNYVVSLKWSNVVALSACDTFQS